MEQITLQAIFVDSYIFNEDTLELQFVFPSNKYKQDFTINIKYSQNYPQEPLEKISIQGQLSVKEIQLITEMLEKEQLNLVNDTEGFVFNLINKIDDDDLILQSNYQTEEKEIEKDEEINDQNINHGQLAGLPLTKENFIQLQQQFILEHKIKMSEDQDFTKIDFTIEQPEFCTGYEQFKRKEYRGENIID